MKEQIKTVSMSDDVEFEKTVNALLEDGWRVSSTSAGFINNENYNYSSLYHAILIKTDVTLADLLPCPFCGHSATMKGNCDDVAWIECSNNSCQAEQRTFEGIDKAIDNWNRRC